MTTPTLTLSRGWLESQRADAMRQGHRARFFCSPISRESTFHRMCNRLPDMENMATRGLYRELCALAFMNDDGTDSGDGRDQLADSSGVAWDIEDVLELVGISRQTWDKLTPPLFAKGYLVWAGDAPAQQDAPPKSTPTPPRTSTAGGAKKGKDTWLTPFNAPWRKLFSTDMHFGQAARELKPLVNEHGQEQVLAAWGAYLREQEPQFISLPRFGEKYGMWAAKARGQDVKSRVGLDERSRRVLGQEV